MKSRKLRMGLLAAAVVGAACFAAQPAKADFGLSIGGRRGGISVYTGSYGFYNYGVPIRSYNYGYYPRPIYRSYYAPYYGHHHHHHGYYHHGHHHHHHHHGHHHHHHGHHHH